MKRFFLGLLVLVTLSSCKTLDGTSPARKHDFRPSAANEAKIGRVYSNVLRIGAIAAPLPPGNWELISWRNWRASNNDPVHSTIFAQHNGRHVTELLNIRTSENTAAHGWQISRICQSSNWHHIEVESYAGGIGEGLCWGVAHSVWSAAFKGALEENRRDIIDWSRSRNLHPFNFGIARVYYAGRRNFILMKHTINPAALGYPDQPGLAWKGHPWSVENLPAGTPAHAFVQDQIRDAEIWWQSFRESWF
jgi:hypothetical protein